MTQGPRTGRGHRAGAAPTGMAAGLALALLVGLAWSAPARTAELVMFESPGCAWCARWHEEIGRIYPKTDESRLAPLRRVALHGPRPADLRDLRAVSFTPTFVLVDDGTELGRITGYAGEHVFWAQLDMVLEALPPEGHPSE